MYTTIKGTINGDKEVIFILEKDFFASSTRCIMANNHYMDKVWYLSWEERRAAAHTPHSYKSVRQAKLGQKRTGNFSKIKKKVGEQVFSYQ